MNRSIPRLQPMLLSVGLSLLLGAHPAMSSDLGERIDKLEAELQQLRKELGKQDGARSDGPGGAGVTSSVPAQPQAAARSGSPSPTTFAGEARVSYYMGPEPFTSVAPDLAPMITGFQALSSDIRLDPAQYGVVQQSILPRYRDHSRYRAVGLLVEGYMEIPQTGPHRFIVAPKPAREGGGSPVTNEMIVHLEVGAEPVFDLHVSSWRNHDISRELKAGRYPFRLWVASNSPGYGPAAIDSRLELGVIMPGRAERVPLSRIVFPPDQE